MSANIEENDGFISVNKLKSRKQKNRKKYKLSEKNIKLLNDLKQISFESQLNLESIESKINSCIQDLKESFYLEKVFQAFHRCVATKFGPDFIEDNMKISSIICYGLGSFCSTIDSLYQLSLLIHLKKFFNPKKVYIFDPVFNKNEINFLRSELKYELIEKNEKCIHSLDSSSDELVMFFMPHCDKSLFNNILWSNWDINSLKNILIFGNSFERISESISSLKIAKRFYRYLYQMTDGFRDALIESKVENSFTPKQIFSDLSIHAINEQNLSQELLQNYYINEEPFYDDIGDVL